MNYRKIPLGRYLKVMKNPSMTFEELANIMYTDVDDSRSWVMFTLEQIHSRDIYIVHSPSDECYRNINVEDYDNVKEMEEEMKVKPLKQLGEL